MFGNQNDFEALYCFLLCAVYGVGVSISQIGKEKNKSNVGAIPFSSSRIASLFS